MRIIATLQARLLINRQYRKQALLLAVCTLLAASLGSCATSTDGRPGSAGPANPADRILACKSTDRLIADNSQCLQDDAACYQIKGGQWCTGPRGNVCPAGSQALAEGDDCPTGSRCFRMSESLMCRI